MEGTGDGEEAAALKGDGDVQRWNVEKKRGLRPGETKADRRRREYADYLRSPEWRAIRARVLDRDMGRCVECGATERLQVHHVTYVRVRRERLADLVTLCNGCHLAAHRL